MKTKETGYYLIGTDLQDKKTSGKEDDGVAQDLRDFFIDGLKDIYWAEKAQTKVIPKMIRKASANDLVQSLTGHLEITQQHIARLESVFSSLDTKAVSRKCEAMEGLIKEAKEIMENTKEGVIRDAGIIAATQKMEHYEIATYGTLCTFAKTLGEKDAAGLLHQTLEEEKAADKKLSAIANSTVYPGAAVPVTEDAGNDSLVEKVRPI
jgi:ferritin-like metal-binding protein YciE